MLLHVTFCLVGIANLILLGQHACNKTRHACMLCGLPFVCILLQQLLCEHLCTVDLVVREPARVDPAAAWAAQEQLPALLPAAVQDWARREVQLPILGCGWSQRR